jgi:thioredoxin-dependent peroxiredoxin
MPMTDLTDSTSPTAIKLEAKYPFPEFALPDQAGKIHRSSDYLGKYLVVYVYPKDDTPGCTKEACDFRDALELRALGAAILGVSADDAASHQEFSEKYSLPFPLLSDPSFATLKSWGAYGSKNMYGKITEGIKRVTFVIDPQGNVVKSWYAVKVEGHVEMVTKAIREHQK